jgi:hypothetical protein
MFECIVQWYLKVPAVLKVTVLLVPDETLPVSQIPASLVEVWETPSLFIQVTVVPLATVNPDGAKEVFTIVTVFGEGFPPGRAFPPSELMELLQLQNPRSPTVAVILASLMTLLLIVDLL